MSSQRREDYRRFFAFIYGEEYSRWEKENSERFPVRFFYIIDWYLKRSPLKDEWSKNPTSEWAKLDGIWPKSQTLNIT